MFNLFRLQISADNAAFEDAPYEVARILREAADRIESGQGNGRLRDFNGNTVGSFDFLDVQNRDVDLADGVQRTFAQGFADANNANIDSGRFAR